MAQVYSENSVGYYTLDLPQGFTMVANQFNNGDNNLNTVLPLPDSLAGAQFLKWDSSAGGQTFLPADDFFGSAFGGWVDANFTPTATTLVPGEGGFINMPAAASVTFVGEVPQGTLNVTIPPLFSIVSQPTPQELGLDAAGLPATVGDQVLFWDNTASPQGFTAALDYFGPAFGGWVDANFTPVDPTPAIGESLFYNSAAATDVTWTRDFDVNQP